MVCYKATFETVFTLSKQSTRKSNVKCDKIRINVFYTEVVAKPLSRTKSAHH